MCNADTTKKLKVVCSTRIFDHVYTCFDLDSGDMKVMTYSNIMDDSYVKYLKGSIMKL